MVFKSIPPGPALHEFVRNYTLLHLTLDTDQPAPIKHRPPKPEQGIVFYLKGHVNLHNLITGDQQRPATVALFSHQTDRKICLLYTSDAADERSSVDLGGRR